MKYKKNANWKLFLNISPIATLWQQDLKKTCNIASHFYIYTLHINSQSTHKQSAVHRSPFACQALSRASTEKGNGLTAGVLTEPLWELLTESAWEPAWTTGVSVYQPLAVRSEGSKVLLGALTPGMPWIPWSDPKIERVMGKEPFESIISVAFEEALTRSRPDKVLSWCLSLCCDDRSISSGWSFFSQPFQPHCTSSSSSLLCSALRHNKKSL